MAALYAIAFNAQDAPAAPPLNIVFSPPGKYGISYDIFTRPLEDPLPDGWARRRCMLKLNSTV